MFYKVDSNKSITNCEIIAYGHTEVGDDTRFRSINQNVFIKDMLSHEARKGLFGFDPPWSKEDHLSIVEKWELQTSIKERVFFFGSTVDLACVAAKKCMDNSNVLANDIDAIIVGTNTGPGYPSLADHIKLFLGQESNAMAWDVTEACSVGSVAIFNGWNLIHSGVCEKVLVVCAEKATTLTSWDNWKGSNLFGDAAFAFLLSKSDKESFLFFDFHSLPFNGQINRILKTEKGFTQDGNSVHKFVGRVVVNSVVEAVEKAGIDYTKINHLVPHQPSGKTLDLFYTKIKKHWPEFKGIFHRNVEFTGNTSGASTGSIISSKIQDNTIKKNDLVIVTTFGAGLSIGNYAFCVTQC